MKRPLTLLAAIIVSASASAIEVGNGDSQHNETIDFSIQYGPWSSSPHRVPRPALIGFSPHASRDQKFTRSQKSTPWRLKPC